MQEDRPSGTPAGTIHINPEEGFGPHISEAFLGFYGEDSAFVTATVDSLTHRFLNVLIQAEKLPPDHMQIQYGSTEMREALDRLLQTLTSRGANGPSVILMRSAVGHDAPQAFERMAGDLLGSELLSNWFSLLEKEDYAGAEALLVAH